MKQRYYKTIEISSILENLQNTVNMIEKCKNFPKTQMMLFNELVKSVRTELLEKCVYAQCVYTPKSERQYCVNVHYREFKNGDIVAGKYIYSYYFETREIAESYARKVMYDDRKLYAFVENN